MFVPCCGSSSTTQSRSSFFSAPSSEAIFLLASVFPPKKRKKSVACGILIGTKIASFGTQFGNFGRIPTNTTKEEKPFQDLFERWRVLHARLFPLLLVFLAAPEAEAEAQATKQLLFLEDFFNLFLFLPLFCRRISFRKKFDSEKPQH